MNIAFVNSIIKYLDDLYQQTKDDEILDIIVKLQELEVKIN